VIIAYLAGINVFVDFCGSRVSKDTGACGGCAKREDLPNRVMPISSNARARGIHPASKYCEYIKIIPFDFWIVLVIFAILALYLYN